MNRGKRVRNWQKALYGIAVVTPLLSMLPPAAAEAILVHRYDFENDMSDSIGSIDGSLPTASGSMPIYDTDVADRVVGTAAIYFDGDDDYAVIPKSAGGETLVAAGAYSLSFWTKLQRNNVQGYFMCDSGNITNLFMQIAPIGYFDGSSSTQVSSNWRFLQSNGDPWPVGEWYHHTIVVPEIATGETGTATWYVNGVAQDTMMLHPFGGLAGDLNLGNRSSDLARDYQGWLDDLQIYQGALTAGNASYLYSNPGSVIPEPGTACLLGVGLFWLLGWARRRKG